MLTYHVFRATVAMVTDDPEHKKNLKKSLSGVFNGNLTLQTDIILRSILYYVDIFYRHIMSIIWGLGFNTVLNIEHYLYFLCN